MINHDSSSQEEIGELDFVLIPDLVQSTARKSPDRLAMVDGERTLEYRDFDALIDRVAASLQRDGIGPQKVVAVCALSSIEYLAVFLGALRAGVTVTPLAPSSTPASLEAMLADCGAQLLFLDASTCGSFAQLDHTIPSINLDGASPGRPVHGWLEPTGARPNVVTVDPDWIFNIIYSSGTTGTPKGIEQSHAMRWQHVRRAGAFGYGPQSVSLVSTPLYSNTTLVAVFPTLAHGGTLVLMKKFDAAAFLALAERHRATHAMLVPVQYRRIMALPEFDRYDLTSFRMKFSTSAPFAAELKADVLARWPGGLVEYYGMTEGGGTCILAAHEFPDRLATVGRPSEGHDIRLIGEDGVEVGPGETGEVVGRSPAMMSGYRNQEAKTAEAEWIDGAGQRFIRTGDVGRFDADGFLTLLDRKKDMIISGGFNVYPSDIEAVLVQHPAVVEAAVIGVASEAWGETPVGFAVVRDRAAIQREALRDWVNARVGKTQRLADIEFVDSLPRSSIGKVLKRELRQRRATAMKSG